MSQHPPGLIAIPALDQMYTLAVEALFAMRKPPNTDVVFARGSTLLDFKRNSLLDCFRQRDRFAWMLMLDSDHTYRPDLLLRLLDRQLPLVGVPYHGRVPPYDLMTWATPTKRLVKKWGGGLREVHMTGTGCLLVRREVVERLSPPYFSFRTDVAAAEDPYFGGGGEDLYFCRKVVEAGFKIMVDLDIPLGHVTPVAIDAVNAEACARSPLERAKALFAR